ncbi:hypothetical protein BV22DRAFT_939153 [Leucogyrophana mollusca]|uniref:Uncharacterized protein n=1 Tax=Leucogyrophana mollusca TaxID=85980 RepID=A0ACB8AWE1_9AGAM|nr:hypothetical protein BV22DRAFT_939153 [Leucogyrophana mollusca]
MPSTMRRTATLDTHSGLRHQRRALDPGIRGSRVPDEGTFGPTAREPLPTKEEKVGLRLCVSHVHGTVEPRTLVTSLVLRYLIIPSRVPSTHGAHLIIAWPLARVMRVFLGPWDSRMHRRSTHAAGDVHLAVGGSSIRTHGWESASLGVSWRRAGRAYRIRMSVCK